MKKRVTKTLKTIIVSALAACVVMGLAAPAAMADEAPAAGGFTIGCNSLVTGDFALDTLSNNTIKGMLISTTTMLLVMIFTQQMKFCGKRKIHYHDQS